MLFLVLAMLVCLGLAVVIVALVAVPARREGREVLAPKGEELVARVQERAEDAVSSAKEKASGLLSASRSDAAPEVPPKA
jgi:peptidoglycan/LPS O-acetylase OafA/YrhL